MKAPDLYSFYSVMLAGLGELPAWFIPTYSDSATSADIVSFVGWQLSIAQKECTPCTTLLSERLQSVEFHVAAPHRQRLVICCGAGVDSTIAIHYALNVRKFQPEDVTVLHIGYGAPYEDKELRAFERIEKRTASCGPIKFEAAKIVDRELKYNKLDASKFPKGYIIPGRNSLLAAIGAKLGDEVWIVSNFRAIESPTAAIDKGRRFYGEITAILSRIMKRPITVASPFLHLSKAETIGWLIGTYGKSTASDILGDTISCYSAVGGRCGECYACFKAARSFLGFDLNELFFSFENDPISGKAAKEYEERERAKGRV